MLRIESDNITAIEVLKHLNALQAELKSRQEDKFLSPLASKERNSVMQTGHYDHIDNICNEFYGKKLFFPLKLLVSLTLLMYSIITMH